ncbi:MAG: hypothetical protein ACI8PT_002436 [Gammaproteobacteria bacterium]|jgi:hypothetical protein
MTKITVLIGGLLCLVGILSFVSTGFEHPTALIPLFVGLPIAICGFFAEKIPAKRKLFMHITVGLGTLGFLASAGRIPSLDGDDAIKAASLWAVCVLCFALVGCYIQSFIKARSNKED